MAFGLVNFHDQFQITEGGVLGAILLLHHWTKLPASLFSIVLDVLSYGAAIKYLGWKFIKKSMIATVFLTLNLRILESYPPVYPQSWSNPVLISILGGVFIGVGVGIVIRYGGSAGGDDAFALILTKKTGIALKYCYLITDLIVLVLSLSYLPLQNIIYSILTVTVSSYLIDALNRRAL